MGNTKECGDYPDPYWLEVGLPVISVILGLESFYSKLKAGIDQVDREVVKQSTILYRVERDIDKIRDYVIR